MIVEHVEIRNLDIYPGWSKPGTLDFDIYNETQDVVASETVTIEELLAALKALGVIE